MQLCDVPWAVWCPACPEALLFPLRHGTAKTLRRTACGPQREENVGMAEQIPNARHMPSFYALRSCVVHGRANSAPGPRTGAAQRRGEGTPLLRHRSERTRFGIRTGWRGNSLCNVMSRPCRTRAQASHDLCAGSARAGVASAWRANGRVRRRERQVAPGVRRHALVEHELEVAASAGPDRSFQGGGARLG